MAAVFTARIQEYQGPGKLDITVKGQDHIGKVFAPTWDIVMGHKRRKYTDAEYTEVYHQIMVDSYRRNRSMWDEVLNRDIVVLCCYCRADAFCHRFILAGYFEKLGSKYYGEIMPR